LTQTPTEQPGDVVLLCDFDGTITEQDVGMELLRRYSRADWEVIEEPFARGEVGILHNMRAQFEHVLEDAPELVEYARSVTTIRPGWATLVSSCEQRGVELVVLSGGLDFYIEALLPTTDPMPEVYSLRTQYTTAGWQVQLPWEEPPEDEKLEFKESVVALFRRTGKRIWFIGNGNSDRGAAHVADRVWAVEPLLTYCREHGVKASEFETFDDVVRDLEALLASPADR